MWSRGHCYDERGAHIHGHTAGDDEAGRPPREWRPRAGVHVTRLRGWHRDPFGIHHERFYYADERPGRLVRDERGRESFNDPPSGFLPSSPEPSSPEAQPGTDRVEVAAAQAVADPGFVTPVIPAATRPAHVPWTGTSRHAPVPDGWVDAPTHGWSNWVHEFTWSGLLHSFKSFKSFKLPSRRILFSVGAAALVILLIVVGLLVSTSPSPHQSAK